MFFHPNTTVSEQSFLVIIPLLKNYFKLNYCNSAILEIIIVDTGYLTAVSESCTMDIEMIKCAKNIFFGG